MTKSRIPPQSPLEDDDQLTEAINRLADEVRVLRIAVDELREEVQYGVRNLVDRPESTPHLRRITSMAVDPAADDFAERLNAYGPEDLPAEVVPPAASSPPGTSNSPPGKLFTEPGEQGRLF